MKTTQILAVTAFAALAFIGGCNKSTKSDMGAVGGQKCSEKGTCPASGTCDAAKKDGAMGAVSGEKKACCEAGKATCSDKK